MSEFNMGMLTLLAVVVILVGAASSCDIRDAKFHLDMADRGLCRQPVGNMLVWAKCQGPDAVLTPK